MKREDFLIATIAQDAREVIKSYGLGVELDEFCTAANMDDERLASSLEAAQRLTALSENRIFHAPFNDIFLSEIDPKMRALGKERLEQAFYMAQSLGYKRIVLHSGYVPFVYFKEWFVEQSAIFWKDFLKDKPQDARFMLENVLDDEPHTMRALTDKINDERFGLCFDMGHANVVTSVPVEEWVDVFGEKLYHIHAHNNYGDRDAHASPEQGSLDVAGLIRRAKEKSPLLSVTFELIDAQPGAEWLEKSGLLED